MADRSTLKEAPAATAPALVPQGSQSGKPSMPLGRPFTLIGARNRAHLHLLSSSVSRNHACIVTTDNGLYLRDLSSRTGALVNGRRVKEIDLRDGDLVQIGTFKFKFTDPAGPVRFPITARAVPGVLEIDGATRTPLDARTLLIGRRATCDVVLTEMTVSSTHALILESNGQRFIRDLGSRTGTFVNGKPVHHQAIEFGDKIRIGETDFRYLSATDWQPEPAISVEDQSQLAPADLDFVPETEEAAAVEDRSDLPPIPLVGSDEQAPELAATEEELLNADELSAPAPLKALPQPDVQTPEHLLTAPADALPEDLDEQGSWTEQVQSAAPPQSPTPFAPTDLNEFPGMTEADAKPQAAEEEPQPATEAPVEPVSASHELPGPIDAAQEDAWSSDAEPALMVDAESIEPQPAHESAGDGIQLTSETPETGEIPTDVQVTSSPDEPHPVDVEEPLAPVAEPVSIEPPIEHAQARESQWTGPSDEHDIAWEPPPDAEAPAEAPSVESADDATTLEPPPPEPSSQLHPSAPIEEPPSEGPPIAQEVTEWLDQAPAAASDAEPAEYATDESIPLLPAEAEAWPEVSSNPDLPRDVSEVDLSAVKFGPDTAETEEPPMEEPAGEASDQPTRLLDLVAAKAPPIEPASEAPSTAQTPSTAETALPEDEVTQPPAPQEAPAAPTEPALTADSYSAFEPSQPSVEQSSEAESQAPPPDAPPAPDAVLTADSYSATEPSGSSVDSSSEVPPEVLDAEAPPKTRRGRKKSATASPRRSSKKKKQEPAAAEDSSPSISADSAQPQVVEDSTATAPQESSQLSGSLADVSETATDAAYSQTPELIEPIADAAERSPAEPAHVPLHASDTTDVAIPTANIGMTGDSEVIADTQPTPDSALNIEPQLEIEQGTEAPSGGDLANEPVLSDAAFDRAIQDFSGAELGPLVEERTPLPDQNELEEPASTSAESAVAVAEEEPQTSELTFDLPDPDLSFELKEPTEQELTSDLTFEEPPIELDSTLLQELRRLPDEHSPDARFFQPKSEPQVTAPSTANPTEPAPTPPAQSGAAARIASPQVPRAAAPTKAAPLPPKPAIDPFFGMSRDLGSFMGGMPLPASRMQQRPPSSPFAQSPLTGIQRSAPGGNRTTQPLTFSDPEPLPALDPKLFAPEEPLELFDGAAEKLDAMPESLEAISDVSGALAEPPRTPPGKAESPFSNGPAAPLGGSLRGKLPPRPQRNAPLRSFTGSPLEPAPPRGAAGQEPQTPPVQGRAASFGAATMPPVRETDVFSQTAFPPLNEAFFGARPKDIPPVPPTEHQPASSGTGGGAATAAPVPAPQATSETMPGPVSQGAATAPAARPRRREAIPPNRQAALRRQPGQPPPATVATQTAPAARRAWWKSIGFLLPLMIVLMLGALAAIFFFLKPLNLVSGTLHVNGLKSLDEFNRKDQLAKLRQALANPDVREIALASLRSQNVPAGFVADPVAMDQLADARNSPFDESSSELRFRRPSTDPDQDRLRMKAILAAVYSDLKPLNDQAATAQQDYEQAKGRLRDLEQQHTTQTAAVNTLQDQINASAGSRAQDVLLDLRGGISALQQKEQQLRPGTQEYDDNHKLLTACRQLLDARAQAASTREKLDEATRDAETLKQKADASISIQPPDDSSVSAAYGPDQRVGFMMGSVIAILLIFAAPLWLSVRSPRTALAHAPAVAMGHEVPGQRAPTSTRPDGPAGLI